MSQFSLTSSYQLVSSWGTGYEVNVILTNSTNIATTTWSSSFTLPDGQSLSSSWDCTMTNKGLNYVATNPTWWGGGVIPANSSVSYGMVLVNPEGTATELLNLTAVANGSVTPPPIPVAPTLNVITSTSATNYTVSWNTVANATSYILQQSTNSSFSSPTTTDVTTTSYSVVGATNGTHYYRVAASNSTGTSAYSNVESITISLTTLSAPILSPINNSGNYTYTVSWSAVTNATGYTLTENGTTVYQGANTSYTVTDKAVGTYTYIVVATAGTITSANSNSETATVTQTPPKSSVFLEGYWESWSSDSIASIVAMNVNIFDIAFATFQSTGTNTFEVVILDQYMDVITEFITAVHAAGKKVKLSIGGATYGMSPFLTSLEAAQGMANAVATFIQANNLEGLDCDFEDYPAYNLQIAFLQNVRSLLPNIILSYTSKTPASTTLPYTQVIQGAYTYLSYVSLMAYDAYAGYSYASDISALIAMGVPASKICLGLMPGLDDEGNMTSLADVVTAANYVVTNGLAGLFYWDCDRDFNNITGLGASAVANAAYPILG